MDWKASEEAISIRELNGLVDPDRDIYCVDQSTSIIDSLIRDLARGLGAKTFSSYDIQKLRNMILEKYQKDLSLNGLAHCFFLIQLGEAPCDKEVMGLNLTAIMTNVGRYVADLLDLRKKLNAQYEDAIADKTQVRSLASSQALLAKAIEDNPVAKKGFKQLRIKLENKYPEVDKNKVLEKIKYESVQHYCEVNLISYDEWVEECKKEYELYKDNIEMDLAGYISHCETSFLNRVNGK